MLATGLDQGDQGHRKEVLMVLPEDLGDLHLTLGSFRAIAEV